MRTHVSDKCRNACLLWFWFRFTVVNENVCSVFACQAELTNEFSNNWIGTQFDRVLNVIDLVRPSCVKQRNPTGSSSDSGKYACQACPFPHLDIKGRLFISTIHN